jgi:hypothetical protein
VQEDALGLSRPVAQQRPELEVRRAPEQQAQAAAGIRRRHGLIGHHEDHIARESAHFRAKRRERRFREELDDARFERATFFDAEPCDSFDAAFTLGADVEFTIGFERGV